MTRLRGLQYALAAALLALLIWRADPGELWREVRQVDLATVLLVLLLDLPIVAAVVLRSHLVIRRLGYRIPARVFVPATVLGYVAGALTPAASGEVLRAAVLRTRAGVPIDQGMALVVYERALSVYLLGLTTAVAIALGSLEALPAVVAGLAGVGLIFVPWLFAAAVLPHLPPETRIEGAGLFARVLRGLLGTARHVQFLIADARLLAAWSLITIGVFLVSAFQVELLAGAVGSDVSLRQAWVGFGGSQLAGIASMLPFGLGVADGSLAAILRRYGLAIEQAGAVVILVRAVVSLPLTLTGFVSYFYLNHTAVENEPRPSST